MSLVSACINGDCAAIQSAVDQNSDLSKDDLMYGFVSAILLNRREIIDVILSSAKYSLFNTSLEVLNVGLIAACHSGNFEIADLMFKSGANIFNVAIYYATLNGHCHLYDLIINNAEIPYFPSFYYPTGFFESGLKGAITNGNPKNIVHYLKNSIPYDDLLLLLFELNNKLLAQIYYRYQNFRNFRTKLSDNRKYDTINYFVNRHLFMVNNAHFPTRLTKETYNIMFQFVCKDIAAFVAAFIGVFKPIRQLSRRKRIRMRKYGW